MSTETHTPDVEVKVFCYLDGCHFDISETVAPVVSEHISKRKMYFNTMEKYFAETSKSNQQISKKDLEKYQEGIALSPFSVNCPHCLRPLSFTINDKTGELVAPPQHQIVKKDKEEEVVREGGIKDRVIQAVTEIEETGKTSVPLVVTTENSRKIESPKEESTLPVKKEVYDKDEVWVSRHPHGEFTVDRIS